MKMATPAPVNRTGLTLVTRSVAVDANATALLACGIAYALDLGAQCGRYALVGVQAEHPIIPGFRDGKRLLFTITLKYTLDQLAVHVFDNAIRTISAEAVHYNNFITP